MPDRRWIRLGSVCSAENRRLSPAADAEFLSTNPPMPTAARPSTPKLAGKDNGSGQFCEGYAEP
jgi:hypothetical protein